MIDSPLGKIEPQAVDEVENIVTQPIVPTHTEADNNNVYAQALTNPALHAKPESMLVSEYAGFDFQKGLELTEPESHIWSAAWHNQGLGITIDAITQGLVQRGSAADYNPMPDIPDRYLNVNDIQYFMDSVNPEMTAAKAVQLDREKRNRASAEASPWQYAGAAMVLSAVDPIFWAFPGTTIARETGLAFKAAWAAKNAKGVAGAVAKLGAGLGLEGATQQAITEVGKQKTQELVTLKESVYDTMAAGLMTAILGPIIPTAANYYSAKKQAISLLAGDDPHPSYQPKSRNFRPPGNEILYGPSPAEFADVKPGNFVPGIPKVVKNLISLSPATKLANSESINANVFSSDFFTLPFLTSENINAKKVSQFAVDQLIDGYKRNINTTMTKVDKLFRQQLGIESGPAQGLRSRIAEKSANFMNREAFSIAVADNLDIGKQHTNSAVNQAADLIRNEILQPTKQRMVELGLMHKRFLDAEYDNYFTRMWQKDKIKKDPQGMGALILKWFRESNDWYRQNFQEVEALNKPVLTNRRNLDIVNRKIQKRVSSTDYKAFQEGKKMSAEAYREFKQQAKEKTKELKAAKKILLKEVVELEKIQKLSKEQKKRLAEKKAILKEIDDSMMAMSKESASRKAEAKAIRATRDEKLVELEQRRDLYKESLEVAENLLYSFIPKKYHTIDGHIPNIKSLDDLKASADQTLTTLLGHDIDNYMNPVLAKSGGGGNPNPMQARVFTIPSGYTANIPMEDGTVRTVGMDDFRSKDIWNMVGNYAKATAATVELTQFAKDRGLKDISELKRWYLEAIEKDYAEKLKGKNGKEAEKLINARERDYKNVTFGFDQMYDVAGRTTSIMGPGFAKFLRRAKMFNGVTLLNSAALASIPDLVMPLFRQGFFGSVGDWTQVLAKKIVTLGQRGTEAFEINKNLLKDMGYALHTEMGYRAKAFVQDQDPLINRAWWRAIAEPIVSMQGNISGMNQIMDMAEGMAGHLSIARTLRILDNKFRKGVYPEREARRNRDVFLSEAHEREIYDMWKEAGDGRYLGSYAANYDKWNINTPERAAAAHAFKQSIIKDLTKSTLKPSKADMPRVIDSDVGAMIMAYKEYMLAANNNILYAGIQKIGLREFDVLLTVALMTSMGSLTYVIQGLARDPTGEKLDLSPTNLALEGVDKSAILGIFLEPINIFRKWGYFPGGAPSRYYNTGMVGTLLGPTVGRGVDLGMQFGDMLQAIYGNKDYTTKDARNILRLIPYQNLFYLRYLNEQVFNQMAVGLGATDKD